MLERNLFLQKGAEMAARTTPNDTISWGGSADTQGLLCLLTPRVLFLWALLTQRGKEELLKSNQSTFSSSETAVDYTNSCQSTVWRHPEQIPSGSKPEDVPSLWDIPHHDSVIKWSIFINLGKAYFQSQMPVLLNQEYTNIGWEETRTYIRQTGSPENINKHVTRTDFTFVSQTCSVSRPKRGGFRLLTHSQAPRLTRQVKPPSTSPVTPVPWGWMRCSLTPVRPGAAD